MTEREKLIKLIERCSCHYSPPCTGECGECHNIEMFDKQMENLADHLLANGVIVPPCYIGQSIWYLHKSYDGLIEVDEGKVSMLQQKADKSWKARITVNSSVWDFTPNEIGTIYFLTKEEAEKALKERSEADDR